MLVAILVKMVKPDGQMPQHGYMYLYNLSSKCEPVGSSELIKLLILLNIDEPPSGKTNNVVSEQV